jgi:hypothetical protein
VTPLSHLSPTSILSCLVAPLPAHPSSFSCPSALPQASSDSCHPSTLTVSFLIALLVAWDAFPFITAGYLIGFRFPILYLRFHFLLGYLWTIFGLTVPVVDPAPIFPWGLLNMSERPSIALESHSLQIPDLSALVCISVPKIIQL